MYADHLFKVRLAVKNAFKGKPVTMTFQEYTELTFGDSPNSMSAVGLVRSCYVMLLLIRRACLFLISVFKLKTYFRAEICACLAHFIEETI